MLYTQDAQYFPDVTSSVTHGSIVSYRMITLFYYCIELDRYIHINMYTNMYQDGRVGERVVCVCVCVCVCVFVNIPIHISRWTGMGRFAL